MARNCHAKNRETMQNTGASPPDRIDSPWSVEQVLTENKYQFMNTGGPRYPRELRSRKIPRITNKTANTGPANNEGRLYSSSVVKATNVITILICLTLNNRLFYFSILTGSLKWDRIKWLIKLIMVAPGNFMGIFEIIHWRRKLDSNHYRPPRVVNFCRHVVVDQNECVPLTRWSL